MTKPITRDLAISVLPRLLAASMPEPNSGCWLWIASVGNSGYGKFRVGRSQDYSAHRASFVAFKSEIPIGQCVLHKCDVRICINPDHLFLGTKHDNTKDMVAKGRHYSHGRTVTHCPQGHAHTGKRNNRGLRICTTCQNERTLRWYHQTKGNQK